MGFRELIERHRQEHSCEESLERALGLLDDASMVIATLSRAVERLSKTIEVLAPHAPSPHAVRGVVTLGGEARMDVQLGSGPVPEAIDWFDANNNPAAAPDGVVVAFSVADPSVATENGDDTVTAAAIGSTTVEATATLPDESTLPIDGAPLNVTAGPAVRGQVRLG